MLTELVQNYLYYYAINASERCMPLCSNNIVIQCYKNGIFSGPDAIKVYFRSHKHEKISWFAPKQVGKRMISVVGEYRKLFFTHTIKIFFIFDENSKIDQITISKG